MVVLARVLLKPADAGLALRLVRATVPVVLNVVQQLNVVEPAAHDMCIKRRTDIRGTQICSDVHRETCGSTSSFASHVLSMLTFTCDCQYRRLDTMDSSLLDRCMEYKSTFLMI